MLNDIVAWIKPIALQIVFELGHLGVMEWSSAVWIVLFLGLNLVLSILNFLLGH